MKNLPCFLASFAALALLSLSPSASLADEPGEKPAMRFGLSGSFGYTTTTGVETPYSGKGPKPWPIGTSMGFGLDLRGGVQLTRWLALDAQLMGETLIFLGQVRAALLVDITPKRAYALGLGAGYGETYLVNFDTGTKTARYYGVIARPELRLVDADDRDITMGVELLVGRTTGGTVDAGHAVFGGRLVVGALFR